MAAPSPIQASKKALGLMTGMSAVNSTRKLLSGKGSRIGNGMALMLVLAAILADLITLIPLVGDFVGPAFWFSVAMYLWMIGCGWTNPEYIITEVLDVILKAIPGIQEFPEITIGILIIILFVRIEDRTGVQALKIAGGKIPKNLNGVRSAQLKAPPLNSDGVRLPNGGPTTQ